MPKRDTKSMGRPLLAAAFCLAGLASPAQPQGGWRQWEVRLRDGTRLEANPLGAPDDAHFSLSVGAYDKRQYRIARTTVRVVAAKPLPGESLPPVPTAASCDDAIVLRDGTTTVGHIVLARVRWSEGTVVQRGTTVDLRDVAYLVFAARERESARCRSEPIQREPDITRPGFTYPDFAYPVGRRQTPRPCADDCQAELLERMLGTSWDAAGARATDATHTRPALQFRATTRVPDDTPSNEVTRSRYVPVAGATHSSPAKYF